MQRQTPCRGQALMPKLVGTGLWWWWGNERGGLHGVINLLTNPGLGQDAAARDEMPGLLSDD